MEIIEFFLRLLGSIFYFLPGLLLNFIIFKKGTILERSIFSLALGASIVIVSGILLANFGWFSPISLSVFLLGLSALLGIMLWKKKAPIKILPEKALFPILGLTVLGTIWRLFLLSRIDIFGDAYGYANYLIRKSIYSTGNIEIFVPNLNFYTGMVKDHAQFLGGTFAKIFWESIALPYQGLEIFLGVFIYLGFIFIVVEKYTQRSGLAYFACAVMALGPIEIWHTTLGFLYDSFSYIALFSLFLLFRCPEKRYFLSALLICFAATLSYYTAALVVIITALGFALACFIQGMQWRKPFFLNALASSRQKIFIWFLLIAGISAIFVFFFSQMAGFTLSIAKTFIPFAEEREPILAYSPIFKFLGISLIRWEGILLLICGLTFFIRRYSFSFERRDIFIALACIPAALLGGAFFLANLPARGFDYLAFFSLIALKLPKKFLRVFVIILLLLLGISIGVRNYQDPAMLSISSSEIASASTIADEFNGTIFTDQSFSNLLIQQDYFDVQGIDDYDLRNIPIYYSNNLSGSLLELRELGAEYIALTKKMREQYVLDLNIAQEPMNNEKMYELYYRKVYDDGDVMVYKVEQI